MPLRMVTDKDGRRKIGYAIPYGWDGTVSDALFYPHVIKMNGKEKDGISFLKAFLRSYISLNHTIDLDAPAYRKYLCTTYVNESLLTEVDGRYSLEDIGYIWNDEVQAQEKYTIAPSSQKGWYEVKVLIERTTDIYYVLRLKLKKQHGHFFITDIKYKNEDSTSDTDAQDYTEPNDKIYTIVDPMPSYPGGTDSLMSFLASHTVYPKSEEKLGHEGRVVVRFVVDRDGSVSRAEVVRSAYKGLDDEALRVVRSMPAWKPGMIDGAPVPVWFTLPITFKLE